MLNEEVYTCTWRKKSVSSQVPAKRIDLVFYSTYAAKSFSLHKVTKTRHTEAKALN